MYLRRIRGKYYQLVRSVRREGKVRQQVISHLGKLSDREAFQLKLILKTKDPDQLKAVAGYLAFQNEAYIKTSQQLETIVTEVPLYVNPAEDEMKQVKFEIDKQWLRKVYLEDKLPLTEIAKMCNVNRAVVRRNLIQAGITTQKEMSERSKKSFHCLEFGWDIINGQKIKNPYEQKIIEAIIYWREKDGMSFESITQKLIEMQVRGKQGSISWDRGTVRRLFLKNTN